MSRELPPRREMMLRDDRGGSVCPECGAALEPQRAGGACAACLLLGATDDAGEPAHLGWLAGHELLEVIARGGMGVVYRARQADPAREVALKALPCACLASEEARQRFRVEAQAMAELEHPGILPIYELGEVDGTPFFTMKLAAGGTLAQRIGAYAGKWRLIAELIARIAGVVQFAHERGVLHRDLKPGNILFDEKDEPFVSDFGLAKFLGDESGLTRTVAVMGTPHYMAPEIALKNAAAATTASDVWSLGAMLYELLAGRPVFHADSVPALLRKIAEDEPPPLDRAIPADLRVIALTAIAKDPSRRYGSARELLLDLRRWLAGEPIEARAVGSGERAWLWMKRNPALSIAATLAVLSLLGGVASLSWGFRSARREVREVSAARVSESEKLRHALLAQSHAARRAMESGWRDSGLSALRQAAAIRSDDDLRDEAIAHLAGVDLEATPGSEIQAIKDASGPDFERFASVMATAGPYSTALGQQHVFDPAGKWMTAIRDGSIELRDRATQAVLASWPALPIARRNDGGRLIALVARDGRIVVIDPATREQKASLPFTSGAAFHLALASRDGEPFVAAARNVATGTTVEILHWQTGAKVHSLALTDRVSSIAWSGDWLACGTQSGRLRLFHLRDARRGHDITAHGDSLPGVCFTPDGQFIAVASSDGSSSLWHVETARLVVRSGDIHPIGIGAGDRIVHGTNAGGGLGRLVRPACVRFLPNRSPRQGPHQTLDFSPDGRWLVAAGGYDGNDGIAIHEAASGRQLAAFSTVAAPIGAFFTADGRSLVAADRKTVSLWQLAIEGSRLAISAKRPLSLPAEPVNLGISIGPDRRWLGLGRILQPVGARRTAVLTLDLQAENPGWDMLETGAYTWTLQPAPEGRWFAGAPSLRIWEQGKKAAIISLTQREPSTTFNPNTAGGSLAHRAVFSPDGRWLAEVRSSRLTIYETGSWKPVLDVPADFQAGSNPAAVDWAPGGGLLAIQHRGSSVKLLEAGTWKTVAVLAGPIEQRIAALRFSPDGRTLALARQAGSLELWGLGKLQMELQALGISMRLPTAMEPAGTPANLSAPLKETVPEPLFD